MDDRDRRYDPELEVPAEPAREGLERQHELSTEQKAATEHQAEQPSQDPGAAVPAVDPASLAKSATSYQITNGPKPAAKPAAATPPATEPIAEKDMVQKAKDIIAKTKDDPYNQKHAISKLSAEVLARNDNLTIKVGD